MTTSRLDVPDAPVVILGVRPSEPDPELGYVSTGSKVIDLLEACRVVGFVEEPAVVREDRNSSP